MTSTNPSATPRPGEGPRWDKSDVVLLRQVPNFGPVTLAEFKTMGIVSMDQIGALGAEGTARLWVQNFPQRLNANAFLGIVTALQGVVWTQANEEHRAQARALTNLLRAEAGLRPVQAPKRKRSVGTLGGVR